MSVNESMLINFQIVMVFMRSDIKNAENKYILEILIRAFDGKLNNQEMCEALAIRRPDWKTQLKYGENTYRLISEKMTGFVRRALGMMEAYLVTNAYDAAYDIADLLHVLPDVVGQENEKQLKRYWKVYVRPFEKKWNCNVFTRYINL